MEETRPLCDQLAAFIEAPNSSLRADILLELFGGPAQGHVHVSSTGGAGGSQQNAPMVMHLGHSQDGNEVLGSRVFIHPPAELPEGVSLKCAPLWQLLRYCMLQGITTLLIDLGEDSPVMIGPIKNDVPLMVTHSGTGEPDRTVLEKLLCPPREQWDGSAPATIIPPGTTMLRRLIAAWSQNESEASARAILHELVTGAVTLFIVVKGRVGGEGEPPITPADLSLVKGQDGMEARIVQAATELMPDEITPSYEQQGLFFRQIPAWKLLQFCLHRGILCIMLDAGLDHGLMIGPFCTDQRPRVARLP
jgi:hypothetical protein